MLKLYKFPYPNIEISVQVPLAEWLRRLPAKQISSEAAVRIR